MSFYKLLFRHRFCFSENELRMNTLWFYSKILMLEVELNRRHLQTLPIHEMNEKNNHLNRISRMRGFFLFQIPLMVFTLGRKIKISLLLHRKNRFESEQNITIVNNIYERFCAVITAEHSTLDGNTNHFPLLHNDRFSAGPKSTGSENASLV